MTTKVKLAEDEQETTFSIEASDRNTVYIFTNDQTWVKRLDKISDAYRTDGYGKFYRLDLKNYTFTVRPKKQMTKEQKVASGVRLQSARKLKETGLD